MSSGGAPLIGSRLVGRYEVLRLIARGGMGDVYEARDEVLQRSVAVKVFRGTAPTDRSRFDAEIKALATLNHPNLVHVFDAGEHDGDGFIVLELIDGPTLGAVLDARGSLPPDEVAGLGAALAGALDAAHAQGVVHRDVTPANVLCGSDGRPRLADFGIARLLDTTRVTASATTIGTAAYMAPEQLLGDDVTGAADVYSLGLVLLEALTGRVAFPGTGPEAAAARLVEAPDVSADVPDGWPPLLREMTAREPADRPSASAVVERLRTMGAVGVGTPVVVAGVGETGDEVDGHAVTTVVPSAAPPLAAVSGGTAVMPVLPQPSPSPDAADRAGEVRGNPAGALASRPGLWLAVAAAVLLVGLLISQSGGGIEMPPTTTTTPVAVTAPVTTTPTTVATTTPPPPPEPAGNGKGRGRDKDDDD